jgi:hypothetical protein
MELLVAAGWHSGRTIDPGPAVELLAERGLVPHEAARGFLAEFGELRIKTSRGPFSLEMKDCLDHLGKDDLPFLGKVTGETLCPVGQGLFLFLLIAPGGDVILLDSHWRRYARFSTIAAAFAVLLLHPVPGVRSATWIELGQERWPPGYQPLGFCET